MDSGGDEIDPEEREALLEDVTRKTATVGHRIPETVDIDGEPFDLREFVWETKRQGRVPPERRDEVQSVRARLKAERNRRKERLAEAALSTDEARDLARSIIGIDRAITALKNLYETDLGDRTESEYVEGTRRWLAFIDQLTE
jgi:hypothetical protein